MEQYTVLEGVVKRFELNLNVTINQIAYENNNTECAQGCSKMIEID